MVRGMTLFFTGIILGVVSFLFLDFLERYQYGVWIPMILAIVLTWVGIYKMGKESSQRFAPAM